MGNLSASGTFTGCNVPTWPLGGITSERANNEH